MAHRLLSCLIAMTFLLSSTGPLMAVQPPIGPAAAVPTQALRASPVMFIENVGQYAAGARFQVLGGADSAGVAGCTYSSDFPSTTGAFDTSHNGGYSVFVAKLNLAGNGLVYATFLGGSTSLPLS